MDKTYNGWKNRQTWNVALWIGNDEPLYRVAVNFAKRNAGRRYCTYTNFIKSEGMEHDSTPDGIKWLGSRLDYRRLSEMIRELIN